MIKGIIFDMDGLIVDTEEIHYKSYEVVLKRYNLTIDVKNYSSFRMTPGKRIEDYLIQLGLATDFIDKIKMEKRQHYYSIIERDLKLIDGVIAVLEYLSENYDLALVTASSKEDTDLIFRIFDIKRYFKTIITKDDVKRVKPDPEGLLLVSKKFNIKPEFILVLEDTWWGIKAAYRAGMKSIAIPNEYTRNNDFSLANIVLKSIKEVTFDLINSL